MHLSKQYVTLEACKAAYERDNWITIDENMICVQNANPGRSACFGDSGGPLYDSVEKKLIGVVSTGPDDCSGKYATILASHIFYDIQFSTPLPNFTSGYPVIYSRVSSEVSVDTAKAQPFIYE